MFLELSYNFILAIGDNGLMINSADGVNWSGDTSFTSRQLNSSVYFTNGSSGFVSFCAGNNGTMLKSQSYLDGYNYIFTVDSTFPATTENLLGMASSYNLPFDHLRSVNFACTDGGKIYKTRIVDITLTPWTQINSGVNVPLRSMATHPGGKVWAVGDNGNIRYSIDTGNTWTGQNSLTTANLYSIYMLDSIHGWIVGDNGVISNTINGGGPIGIQPVSTGIPANYSLSQNYPNPFNPTTNFEFRISKFGLVNIKIYDVQGKLVSTILNEELKPGSYKADFDGSKFSSGVYFYKLIAGDFVETKKMLMIK